MQGFKNFSKTARELVHRIQKIDSSYYPKVIFCSAMDTSLYWYFGFTTNDSKKQKNADVASNVCCECGQWVQVDLEQCEGLP
jgi:hypothetical protein